MARIPAEIQRRIRAEAHNRCGYCLSSQDFVPIPFEVEHLIPTSKGGTDEEINLWLACSRCNKHKSDKTHAEDPATGNLVPLFNPRFDKWAEHFRWSKSGTRVIGLTAIGRATVLGLRLNSQIVVKTRANWVKAGWHPPKD
jgi:5-methylcytosine-specific restriction endonuclease McrA